MSNTNDPQNKVDLINALRNEAFKEFNEYDVNNRVTYKVQAPTDAPVGANALRTDYTYTTPTSTLKRTLKETIVSWQAIWD